MDIQINEKEEVCENESFLESLHSHSLPPPKKKPTFIELKKIFIKFNQDEMLWYNN